MRTKNEIKQAVAILTRKADRLSLVQAEVLQGSMTEQQVFQKYVMEVAEENRDEEMFFAARDAARFSAGHIGLEELIPDVQSMTAADFAAAGALGRRSRYRCRRTHDDEAYRRSFYSADCTRIHQYIRNRQTRK